MYYRPRSRWPGTPKQVTLFRLFTFSDFINNANLPSHSFAENFVHHPYRRPRLPAVVEGTHSPAHRVYRIVPGSTGLQVLCASHNRVSPLFLNHQLHQLLMSTLPVTPAIPLSAEKALTPAAETQAEEVKPTSSIRNPIPKFLTMRSGSQSPERLLSTSNPEDVKAMVSRQVKAAGGGTRYIAVYQLMFVEVYEPSSRTLSPDQFDEMMERQSRLEQEVSGEGI